jgi:hypothetical protein
MVFETLGLSLYDFLKKNHYRGIISLQSRISDEFYLIIL